MRSFLESQLSFYVLNKCIGKNERKKETQTNRMTNDYLLFEFFTVLDLSVDEHSLCPQRYISQKKKTTKLNKTSHRTYIYIKDAPYEEKETTTTTMKR